MSDEYIDKTEQLAADAYVAVMDLNNAWADHYLVAWRVRAGKQGICSAAELEQWMKEEAEAWTELERARERYREVEREARKLDGSES